GGEQFVRFLDQGAKSLQELQREARAAGVVLDASVVEKGAEIDRAFTKLSDTISTRLKGGIISTASAFDDFAAKVQSFMTSVGNANLWQTFSAGYSSPDVQKITSDMDRARAELAKRLKAGEQFKTDGTDWLYKPPAYTPPAPKAQKTPGQKFDEDVLKVRDEIAALEAEQAALGKSAFEAARLRKEQELLTQARRDGVALSPELRARIDEEAQAYATASANLEGAKAKMERVRDLQSFAGEELTSSLSGLLTGTQTVSEALDSLIKKLIEAALQAALLGQGPLAGFLGMGTGGGIVGGLFGGFRAEGGEVERGKLYVTGERGPELFAPGRSGTVIPHDMLKSIRPPTVNVQAAQPAAPAITFAPVVNVTGGGGSLSENRDLSIQMVNQLRGLLREEMFEFVRVQQGPHGILER
ncbi:hypothetical protein V5F70_24435, partial [Xanthobacter autotrophicus NCIMB 11399]